MSCEMKAGVFYICICHSNVASIKTNECTRHLLVYLEVIIICIDTQKKKNFEMNKSTIIEKINLGL